MNMNTTHEPVSTVGIWFRSLAAIPFVVLDAVLFMTYFIALGLMAIIGFVTISAHSVWHSLFAHSAKP